MKKIAIIITLTISGLSLDAQNLVTNQVFINTSNYANSQQFVLNNSENNVPANQNPQSARNSFGNLRGNRGVVTQNKTPKNHVKVTNSQSTNVVNDNVNDNANRNEPVQVNRQINIQSNPIQVNTVQVEKVQKKTDVPVGLDFTPSGLSGRDYSNGGKLKKGEKNFYTQSYKLPVSKVKKRKANAHKKSYITHGCAKWKA